MDDDMFRYKRKNSYVIPVIKPNKCCLPLYNDLSAVGDNHTSCINDIREMLLDDNNSSEVFDFISFSRYKKDKLSGFVLTDIHRGEEIELPYLEMLEPLPSREEVRAAISCKHQEIKGILMKEKKLDESSFTLRKSLACIRFPSRHESESSIIQLS
jgi:hypothetical protein